MILFIFGSQISANGQETVFVNIDKNTTIGVSDFASFEILDSPEHLIGGIQELRLVPEIGFLIKSQGNLFLYDFKSKSITIKYSRIGHAENEYTSITDYGYEDGLVFIYDLNTNKVLWFTIDGKYDHSTIVSEKASANPFCLIKKLNDEYWVGRRVYQGMKTTALSLYSSSNLAFTKEISPEIFINSGIMLSNPFFNGSDNDILYYKVFNNNIYSIKGDNVKIKYNIDFGKYTFSNPEKYNDEYEIINELNNSGKKEYASLLHPNFYEDKEILSFMVALSGGKPYLATYNKKQQKTDVWFISEPDYIVLEIAPSKDVTYIFMEDLDGEIYVGEFISK